MDIETRIRKDKEAIHRSRSRLEENLREYTRLQVKHWQTVPYLAVNASNKKEYPEPDTELRGKVNSRYELREYWPLNKTNFYVECFTGELVYRSTWTPERNGPASQEDVLSLAEQINLLDAESLVRRLEALGSLPERGTYQITRSDCHYSSWTEDANDERIKNEKLKRPEIIKSKSFYETYRKGSEDRRHPPKRGRNR
ncbi:hypothetical protein JW711_01445 [Candidatus Woesearchaeota archaeon]|nr:hypothetical protein [Candidatus Woesearchaeota archaeon]